MQVEQEQLEYFATFLKRRSGMVISTEKAYLVEARLGKVARARGFDDFRQLMTRLTGKDDDLEKEVVDAMTINETSFFRDMVPFQTLEKAIVPVVMEKRKTTKAINIWCAASSTGQEPYTVTMMLREKFPQLKDWRIRFIASDISDTVLEKAREGKYSQLEVNRGLPAPLLIKYFDRVGAQWQIKEEIRKAVEFRKVNLLGDWTGLNNLDVVLMRNVLIYFDVETKRTIMAKVRERLVPHGFLMLGGAESTLNIDDNFERLEGARCSAYRLKK